MFSLNYRCLQVSSKRDALEEKSTGARNDYLLSLAAANAHQNRYFVVDLQNTMQVSGYNSLRVCFHVLAVGKRFEEKRIFLLFVGNSI